MKLVVFGMLFGMMSVVATAQTTAMDFHRMDCNGNMQHLFADLDAGNAVILEFFMNNCSPCVTAGSKLEAMKADLLAEYPGMIKAYTFGFTNSYSCTTVANWVSNNGFTSVPLDSGAAQVSYYGGFGMPTIVILGGGTNHSILGSTYVGFTTSDTIQMAADIRAFLSTPTGIDALPELQNGISVYPNPSNGMTTLRYSATEAGTLTAEVLDITGRKVMSLVHDTVAAGEITKTFSTAEVATGAYILKVSLNGAVTSHRFLVAR